MLKKRVVGEMKRILILSNNVLSEISNNGKTLLSFFKNYECSHIAQLYFSDEIPDVECFTKYYRISDKDILKAIFRRHAECGHSVSTTDVNKEIKRNIFMPKNYFLRFLREVLWYSKRWRTERLKGWLNEFSPDLVFFMGGDCCFAYDICEYICDTTGAVPVLYITDDYILKRYEVSPFFWIRRGMLLRRMKKLTKRCVDFFTISEPMRKCYKDVLGKDSIVIANVSIDLHDAVPINSKYELIYAGGLHYNRWKTLSAIGYALSMYNIDAEKKAHLTIYSTKKPSTKVLNALEQHTACSYRGTLAADEIMKELQAADILVHAEAFDRKSRQATRLSFSTKIPEYLSLRKCILAVGPKELASMEYLKDCAFSITDPVMINKTNMAMLFNENELEHMAERAYEKYLKNHSVEMIRERFIERLTNS